MNRSLKGQIYIMSKAQGRTNAETMNLIIGQVKPRAWERIMNQAVLHILYELNEPKIILRL